MGGDALNGGKLGLGTDTDQIHERQADAYIRSGGLTNQER